MTDSGSPARAATSVSYTGEFFRRQLGGVRRSASVIVPLVIEMLGPASVADVGCGTGAWLAAFRGHGISDIFGIIPASSGGMRRTHCCMHTRTCAPAIRDYARKVNAPRLLRCPLFTRPRI